MVLLSPEDADECTKAEGDFLKIANAVDLTLMKLSNSEKDILVKRYDFLSNVASYSGLLLGVSNTAWNAHAKQVESILKALERSYVTSYKATGNLNNQGFFTQRNIQQTRLNAALSRFMQPTLGGNLNAGDILDEGINFYTLNIFLTMIGILQYATVFLSSFHAKRYGMLDKRKNVPKPLQRLFIFAFGWFMSSVALMVISVIITEVYELN